jgi:serine/threonine protein kinase
MTDDRTQIVVRSSTVEVGAELNQTYRIDALIGVGGMGEVYKGHNIQTGDPVAIKVVLPEFARDEMIFELFRKEARVLNHLAHDAIVRYYVFSIDRTLGRPYLAMEFADGPSLAAHIKSAPLTPITFFGLLRRLADGLHKAHEAGVIHRDISPDNVILPEGQVERAKIIDFGIARTASVGGGTLLGGSFAGKYSYVSPEQLGLFGGEVTPKSDIYSLGLTMAAAIRGTPIDMSGSQVEVIEKRRSVPDLTAAGIPKQVHAILSRMLQPDPADRPASMAEVRDWVDKETEAPKGKPKDAKPSQGKSRSDSNFKSDGVRAANLAAPPGNNSIRNAAIAIGIVAAVAVGGLGGWIYVQGQNGPDVSVVTAETTLQPAPELTPESKPEPEAVPNAQPAPAPQQNKPDSAPVPKPQPAPKPQPETLPIPKPQPIAVPPALKPQPEPEPLPKPQPALVPEVPKPQAASTPKPTLAQQPQPVPKPATSPPVPETLPAPKPLPAPPQAKLSVAALTQIVSDFGEGKCFKADVTSMSETAVRLNAIGTDVERSNFERAFVAKAGFQPDVTLQTVTTAQCPVVANIAKLPKNNKMPIQVKLDRDVIRGTQSDQAKIGDGLMVSVKGVEGRNVYLYVVDYEGGVVNINRACSDCLQISSDQVTAAISFEPLNVEAGQPPQSQPYVILVVAADNPLLPINNKSAYESDEFAKALLETSLSAKNFSAQTGYLTLKSQ